MSTRPSEFTVPRSHYADQVQRIPLSCGEANDVVFWPFVQSREYTVKSVYFSLKTESKNSSNEFGSSSEHTKLIWKQKWKLVVPSKINNFLWSLAKMHCQQMQIWSDVVLGRRSTMEFQDCHYTHKFFTAAGVCFGFGFFTRIIHHGQMDNLVKDCHSSSSGSRGRNKNEVESSSK
ncbi:hypothetical protein CMV_012426 [Castanea mollissima]|uniref:Uncharacterized protein n=1 Tax=Castanea mollissima TaxID=60419 RepID=A0A8J4R9J1_9ROSI|nr:hypothetical protein CMV_012426 [Castanea mollissima]